MNAVVHRKQKKLLQLLRHVFEVHMISGSDIVAWVALDLWRP